MLDVTLRRRRNNLLLTSPGHLYMLMEQALLRLNSVLAVLKPLAAVRRIIGTLTSEPLISEPLHVFHIHANLHLRPVAGLLDEASCDALPLLVGERRAGPEGPAPR